MKSIEQADIEVRAVLRDHGRLAQDIATLAPDADLYQAGMTSHASVNVMLALEGKFDVEFPDRMLKRSVFASIDAIRAALAELGAVAESADAQIAQA
jgi:acyl carrier protein